jgi:GxxExxY protein
MPNLPDNQATAHADLLTGKVIGEAMHVHRILGPGFVKSIYHKALEIRLGKAGMRVESQKAFPVNFEGEVIGEFQVDMMVGDCLVLGLKAVSALNSDDEVQMVNHLTVTKLDVGLILNFGAPGLEMKRKSRKQDFSFPRLPESPRSPSGKVRSS